MVKTGKATIKNGYSRIANEILEELAGTDLNGESLKIALLIMRMSYGYRGSKWTAPLGYSYFVKLAKVKKPNAIRAINTLESRKMIQVDRSGFRNKYKFNNLYKEWNSPQYELKL